MSLKFVLISCILIGSVSAGLSRKRRGTYEDEAVTPAGGGASVAPMAEEPAVTVAPEGAGAQISNVESSGYRKKRASQNSYGDEASAPVGGGAPVVDVSEAPAVTVDNAGGSHSDVASSGY
ncbi:hypothetical protein GCK72_013786 [Caenorhabditis remanei]|uniref:Secreted protein n=1 Tax=Caenorhabditis remanei TaxID=31234 RepID=A0A6A5GRM6_CAERE|nr:hypothetical protein GCK72_013786 [Caenorhabditis remanei]KAF1757331.1 hypothetical protein GCK72_013786 [Caenorhabditis remanei]